MKKLKYIFLFVSFSALSQEQIETRQIEDGAITFPKLSGVLDEDDFSSNSDTNLATQQSIKAYVDANSSGSGESTTVADTPTIDLTLTGDTITADVIQGGISYNNIAETPTIPSLTSDLTNDSGFLTSEVDGSQTNEIQSISIVDDEIRLSFSSSFADLSPYKQTECSSDSCDLDPLTTIGGATIQLGVDDDVPEAGDFGDAADLDANGALVSGSVGASELTSTSVIAGSYTSANITVDGDGRITSAEDGSATTNTNAIMFFPLVLSGWSTNPTYWWARRNTSHFGDQWLGGGASPSFNRLSVASSVVFLLGGQVIKKVHIRIGQILGGGGDYTEFDDADIAVYAVRFDSGALWDSDSDMVVTEVHTQNIENTLTSNNDLIGLTVDIADFTLLNDSYLVLAGRINVDDGLDYSAFPRLTVNVTLEYE